MISAMRTRAPALRHALFVALSALAVGPAMAQETVTYAYDNKGRVTGVAHSGGPANGVNASYTYDNADNRTNVTVSTNACVGISFTIASNGAVTEGASSVFTITKTGTTSSSCSVSYATASGTATSGSDFNPASGTLTFSSTQTSQTVSVATIDDTTAESQETFTMGLSSPLNGATLGSPSTATATINDNDTAAGPSFAINDVTVDQGAPATFTITKTGATGSTITVNYATANGTGVAGTAYTATSGTLSFAPSVNSLTVTVQTLSSGALHDKTFYLNLSGASGGATISDTQGLGTINGDPGGGCTKCM